VARDPQRARRLTIAVNRRRGGGAAVPGRRSCAAIRVRGAPLLIDMLRKVRARGASFEPACLIVETLQCSQLCLAAEVGLRKLRSSAPGSSDRKL
jgi:hypothetical protein